MKAIAIPLLYHSCRQPYMTSQILTNELDFEFVNHMEFLSDERLRGRLKAVERHEHLRELVRSVSLHDPNSLDLRVWKLLPSLPSLEHASVVWRFFGLLTSLLAVPSV